MSKLFSLLGMGIMVMWLAVSCKKDVDEPTPPDDAEPVETQPAVLRPVTVEIGTNVKGYYEALPALYHETTRKYPLLIYFHGSGQIGNGSTDLDKVLREGTAKLLAEKKFPPNFVSNGQKFSFIVLMPQFKAAPSNADVKAFVDYAKANYRYDASRVYTSGLSMGARALTEFATAYPSEQVAIVPMAGALVYDLSKKAKQIVDYKIAAWVFHNEHDQAISSVESKNFVNAVNNFGPAIPARLTIFPTSDSPLEHDSWTISTDPNYKEDGKNIYEWMLQYRK